MKRVFLPWEINHLRKYGFSETDLDTIGTTPVEYITNHAQFRGLDFYVTPDCLIPRIETEKIIDICLRFITNNRNRSSLVIADVGCGSGALGISLSSELNTMGIKNFHLILSDISQAALNIAQKNSDSLIPWMKDRITFLKSDLLDAFPRDKKIDYLISNLPYIPTDRISTLDPSVKDHEPVSALDGGPDGTLLINRLLNKASSLLKPNPLLVFEIDNEHKLSDFDIPTGFSASIEKDDFDQPRYLIITST